MAVSEGFIYLKVAICNLDRNEMVVTSDPDLVFNLTLGKLEKTVSNWSYCDKIIMLSFTEQYKGLDYHVTRVTKSMRIDEPVTLKRISEYGLDYIDFLVDDVKYTTKQFTLL
jgi:hypothetical protein